VDLEYQAKVVMVVRVEPISLLIEKVAGAVARAVLEQMQVRPRQMAVLDCNQI
jgi:hypothetical protein